MSTRWLVRSLYEDHLGETDLVEERAGDVAYDG